MSPAENPLLLTLKHNKLAISLFLISLLLLGGGLIAYLVTYQPQRRDQITIESSDTADTSSNIVVSPQTQKVFMVDISGAVINPGVYTLSENSRLQDAILAAGGVAPDADSRQIAKSLNLAAKIRDGQKIYIPFQGEIVNAQEQAGAINEEGVTIINLNTASLTELDSLPGIGQTIAQKIINNRPYTVISDLQTKKIIGAKVFSDIKERISVDD